MSDWSSDVCSSDLAECAAQDQRQGCAVAADDPGARQRLAQRDQCMQHEPDHGQPGRPLSPPMEPWSSDGPDPIGEWPESPSGIAGIGRASCLEGEGTYVEISEFDVTLKKNK